MRFLFLALMALIGFSSGFGQVHHVILTGSGGEPQYQDRFAQWAQRLHDWLLDNGIEKEQIHGLGEANAQRVPSFGDIDLDAIETLFGKLAQTGSDEEVFVYLIGHGSFLDNASKFQIPGEDLTSSRLQQLLQQLPTGRIAVINGTSSSAGFINDLSREGRIVVTATKHAGERNATEFMEHFITALEDGSADRNRDQRISIWEASAQAAALTRAWYDSMGLIATEDALLDDNGDALGTRLHPARSQNQKDKSNWDGKVASRFYLKNFSFPKAAPAELVDQYLGLMEGVEALKRQRGEMSDQEYWRSLETQLLSAARIHKRIRSYGE